MTSSTAVGQRGSGTRQRDAAYARDRADRPPARRVAARVRSAIAPQIMRPGTAATAVQVSANPAATTDQPERVRQVHHEEARQAGLRRARKRKPVRRQLEGCWAFAG